MSKSKKRTPQEGDFLRNFGDRLESLRNKKGFSQEELAAEAEFSRSYYTEVETGKRNISLLNLRKLALTLQVSLAELLDFDLRGS
jgi:transcriptional regulator with XRE-family HTH domain